MTKSKNKFHKKLSALFCLWVSILCVLCASVVNSTAQDWKTVNDGIEYAEVTREISGLKVNMNLLRLDLTKVRLDVVHAMDAAIGTEKTSSIAARHGAFAAINAGFFRLDTSEFAGDAAGILQIDNELISDSLFDRIAVAIHNSPKKTKVDFGHANSHAWVSISPNFSSITVDGIDREPKPNETILFTKEFGITPRMKTSTAELVLSDCLYVCRKYKLSDGAGGTPVPKNGYVLVLYDEKVNLMTAELRVKLKELYLGPTVNNIIRLKDGKKRRFDKAEDIVGGVPQLIKNGKIDITWEQEKATRSFVETRHPRTAVAKLKDGKFLMITVDGRSESSGGIGLQDLAEYLLSLGATDAMNLDGGGSTTMFLNGKVVNHPSDKEGERKVSDAILVKLRNKK